MSWRSALEVPTQISVKNSSDPGLRDLIARPQRVIVLTGAGISVASGLSAYRGAAGSRYDDPKALREAMASTLRSDPAGYWRRHAVRRQEFLRARPNDAHRALERYAQAPRQVLLVTQNIDELHARAGSWPVVELHGNAFGLRCMDDHCQEARRRDCSDPELASEMMPPRCTTCGGWMRPDLVLFGEGDEARWTPVETFISGGVDLIMIVGTSGSVSVPEALLLRLAQAQVAPIALEVNPQPMPESKLAGASEAFSDWIQVIEKAETALPKLLQSSLKPPSQS